MAKSTAAALTVAEARARVLSGVVSVAVERVAIGAIATEAAPRVLAEELKATRTQPPFDSSAMDGYAVRELDLTELPVTLTIIGEAAAGKGFRGSIRAGEAVRIFTGAPIPTGADAVVIQEDTTRDDHHVSIRGGRVESGHIRRMGFDFTAGKTLLPARRRLSARDITLAAAMGHGELAVFRRPRVAIIATGDELVMPGEIPGPDQIVCSNPFGIAQMVARFGGTPQILPIAQDNRGDLTARINDAREADIIVTIGGASVGDHDIVGPVLTDLGMELGFWKIAMRPGKPLMYGRLGPQHVIGLPGNPVSSLTCARIFLMPLIEALSGLDVSESDLITAITEVGLEANGPRMHYMRGTSRLDRDGRRLAAPVFSQDSSLLAPLSNADCLIVRPIGAPALAAGAPIEILPLDF